VTRARTLLAICALALPIPVAIAGCGGGDDDDDPRAVLERTFDNDADVTSGVFDLSLDVSAEGQEEGSFAAELGGAFQGDASEEGTLPQLDLSGNVSGEGGGESVDESARLVLTEESAFVEYQDETYEVGARQFAQFKEAFESQAQDTEGEGTSFRESCEQAIEQAGGDPAACDIDVVGEWFTNLENEGTEDVEGAETTHISGDLDVERTLSDIGDLVATVPGADLQGFEPSQLAGAVPEASFDVYSGTDDDVLRRLEINLVIDPGAATGGVVPVPVDQVDFGLSFTLSALNEPQTIDTPSGPTRPIEDLLGEGAFDFGGGLAPGGLSPGSGGAGGGGGGAGGAGAPAVPEGAPSDEQAQEYLECIAEAGGDPEAIQACGDALQ
jgi:hypothetical protein